MGKTPTQIWNKKLSDVKSAERINPEWVSQRLADVENEYGNIAAHELGDELLYAVLKHIANGTAEDPGECANRALCVLTLEGYEARSYGGD